MSIINGNSVILLQNLGKELIAVAICVMYLQWSMIYPVSVPYSGDDPVSMGIVP
jgi:hypothetical protein